MFDDGWLRSNTDAPADNIDVYIANLRQLFHRPLQEQYNTELEEMAKNGVLGIKILLGVAQIAYH